jgi:hypothetical protein
MAADDVQDIKSILAAVTREFSAVREFRNGTERGHHPAAPAPTPAPAPGKTGGETCQITLAT